MSKLYWPGEYVGDGEGGMEKLKVETLTHPDDRYGDRAETYGKENMLLLLPSNPNPNAHPQRGKAELGVSTTAPREDMFVGHVC